MRAIGETDRRRGAAYLFHRNHMLEVAKTAAAVLDCDGDAVQPELTELRPKIARKLVVAIDRVCARGNALLREIPHCLAQEFDTLAQVEVECCQDPSLIRRAEQSLGSSLHRQVVADTRPRGGDTGSRAAHSRMAERRAVDCICTSARARRGTAPCA